jgi:hypothetical protein
MPRNLWVVLCCLWIPAAGRANELALDIRVDPESGRPPVRRSACLNTEPTANEVVKAAWKEAGLLPEEDRSRKWRVRLSGWLPRLTGGVSKDTGDKRDYRYEPGSPRVDQFHLDDGLGWDAGLTWDLSRMAFQSEELQVAREASRRVRERLDLAAEVIRLYFSRRRLTLQGLPLPNTPEAVQLLEATALLNAWTGSRLSERWCSVEVRR